MISSITSKVVSTLGNKEALTPLLVKDVATSLSMTHYAKKEGGDIEKKDRCIDEFGTLAIWLGGIPFFKGLIDKTAYKLAKLDPNVDVRVTENSAHADFAKKYAKDKEKSAVDFALKHKKLTRNMFYSKFGLATALTIASYVGLTKIRHNITKKASEKKVYNEIAREHFSKKLIEENTKLRFAVSKEKNQTSFKSNSDKVSFGLSGKGIQAFMFDPALNTSIVDLSILGTRLATSRPSEKKKQVFTPERVEYLAKDGFLMFFYYAFSHCIQPKMDKAIGKFIKKPIDIDVRALNSKELLNSMSDKKQFDTDLAKFKKAGSDAEILEFLEKNPDNIVTKVAKISDVVKTKAKSQAIDHRKYIDTTAVTGIANDLEKLGKAAFGETQKNINKFLKSARNAKVVSILAGLGTCVFGLGYLMPNFLYNVVRKKYNNGSTAFHVQENLEKEIKQKILLSMK